VAVEVDILVGVESMTIFDPVSEFSSPCIVQPDNKARFARRSDKIIFRYTLILFKVAFFQYFFGSAFIPSYDYRLE